MAIATNTFTGFDAIGEREDLSDIIYDISPQDTPFMSRAAKMSSSAVFTEWQTDVLKAAAANRQLEGDDSPSQTLSPTTRIGNKMLFPLNPVNCWKLLTHNSEDNQQPSLKGNLSEGSETNVYDLSMVMKQHERGALNMSDDIVRAYRKL